jgi:hypothetical protein
MNAIPHGLKTASFMLCLAIEFYPSNQPELVAKESQLSRFYRAAHK